MASMEMCSGKRCGARAVVAIGIRVNPEPPLKRQALTKFLFLRQAKQMTAPPSLVRKTVRSLSTGRSINELTVITGPSGSGKSSLAFQTIYAEGQRRYIETFSPYTRQFFDRMDKPLVDSIEGIPPAIAIEQVNNVKTTRSTVGSIDHWDEKVECASR